MTPLSWLYMKRQSWLETTVGMAHGINIDVRTTPRPLKFELMINAIAIPRTVSMATEKTVKVIVCPSALMKTLSDKQARVVVESDVALRTGTAEARVREAEPE